MSVMGKNKNTKSRQNLHYIHPNNQMTKLPNIYPYIYIPYNIFLLITSHPRNNHQNMTLTKTSLVLLLCFLGFYSETVKSQNCGCSPDLCCSQFSFCGTGNDYCGPGCQSGPCTTQAESLGTIVSQSFFDGITNRAGSDCAGKGFYTRDAFINAANTFPSFANSVTSLEIATMFAHFTQEVGCKNSFHFLWYIYFSKFFSYINLK